MFPRVVQYGDGRDATATAASAPSEAASPAESDRVTRTRTRTGASDSPEGSDSPRNPVGALATGDRLPAPLQYRDPARYEIVAEHGRGGLGRVFRARDKELGRDVALKELLSRGSTTELRFFREALITARLEHPGIVPVHEAGRWPDGTPFYAMKLVAGRPLKALIDECKTLEERLALLPHVIAVADAIAYAHDRKIIHRDLKPSNIIVGDFGETVVIDWGLAKDISGQAPVDDPVEDGPYRTFAPANDGVTVAGSIVGTPAYMSPEQSRGEPVDERTDVYAIGAILHELCAGRPDGSSLDVRRRVGIDADLTSIVARAVHRDANRRHSTARLLADDLHSYSRGLRVSSRRYSLPALLSLWIRRNKRLATVSLVMFASLVAVAASATLSVLSERDKAESSRHKEEAAHQTASEERDRALLAQAKLVLDRDPTTALDLARRVPDSPDSALVRARALGEHRATYSMSLMTPFGASTSSPDGNLFALATLDRRLQVVDPATDRRVDIANDLPEAANITYGQNGWWYVASPQGKTQLRHTSRAVAIPLPSEVAHILAAGPFTLLVLTDRTLIEVGQDATIRTLYRGVSAATLQTNGTAIICSDSNVLLRATAETRKFIVAGECDSTRSELVLASSDHALVVPLPGGDVRLHLSSGVVRLSPRAGRTFSHAAAAGPVGLIDSAGDGYIVDEGGRLIPGFSHPTRATAVAANGAVIAWAYADGTVLAHNMNSNESWSVKAHPEALDHISIARDGRSLLTASSERVRTWSLERGELQPRSNMQCISFNVAVEPSNRLVATDCSGGAVVLHDLAAGTSRVLHRHREMSFGLTWLSSAICSGGWDGAVMCTDIDDTRTWTVSDHDTPVRWMAADSSTLVYATADGGVWITDLATPPRELATLDEEPYRIAITTTHVTVATYGGHLVWIDRGSGTVTSVLAHEDPVTGVVALGAEAVLSSSLDGEVRRWRTSTLEGEWTLGGPVRLVHPLSADSFVATVSQRTLALISPSVRLRLDIGAPITGLTSTGRFVALATNSGEIVSIDRQKFLIASSNLHDGAVRAIAPLGTDSLAVSTATGSMYRLDLSSLIYTPFPFALKGQEK